MCIQETRLDEYDTLDKLHFKCLPLMTRNNAKIRSGGIAILVKEHLFDYIKIVKNDGDQFYWFTLENYFTYNILFCVAYIAPEGSNYSSIECFDLLESDIINLTSKFKCFKLCLLGDFNAHTRNEYDFTAVDGNIQQSDMVYADSSLDYCSIEQLGFSTERYNSDLSRVNDYGRQLSELCRSCDIYIANGRLGLDRLLGSKTCKGTSVVDYVILSPSLFPYISEFEVLPFDPMTSDAHCGLHFSLTCNDMNGEQHTHDDNNPVTITGAKWNSVESASSVGLLNGNKIDSFIRKIDALNTNEQQSTQVINELTSECSSILTTLVNVYVDLVVFTCIAGTS